MRVSPTKFLTDFDSGKSLFYVVKVVSDSNTYYWHTAREAFTLWDTTTSDPGHIALTKDAGRIAESVNGQEEAIGDVEMGLSIEELGGGSGEIGAFSFVVLNQDEFSDTINSQEFVNRKAELRMGFVDTVNGTGWDDCLIVANYIVDNVEFYDWGRTAFRCTDPAINLDKPLPNSVTRATHPRAPESSIGVAIPILYGDFMTLNAVTNAQGYKDARLFEKYELAPTIVSNFSASGFGSKPNFVIAGHELHTVSELFYDSGETLGTVDASSYSFVNNATNGGFNVTRDFLVDWVIIPDSVGSGTTVSETAGNQFDYAKDKDEITSYFLSNPSTSSEYLYFKLNRSGEGIFTNLSINFLMSFANIAYTSTGDVYFAPIGRYQESSTTEGSQITPWQGNSWQIRNVPVVPPGSVDNLDWSNVGNDWEFGFRIRIMQATIKHFCLIIRTRVSNKFGVRRFFGSRIPTNRGDGGPVRGGGVR